ncbi:hypothetical protein [Rhizobium sp. BK376]|jgi:hypothetical protein|uniref:hypothetical protein n=1 Tax=Rhizobium sp. BK376 TaxID=2512149 RepID=UPI00104636CA|nr:hypothetical protein [Rhizobium sp. BK376]TCR90040.1 hypothetical protein EV561_104265 [Rhizobium sp. BK376]
MGSGAGRILAAAGILISLWPAAARPAELPVFQGYCEEMSQRALNPAQGFLAYIQCTTQENRAKAQLARHWSLVTDSDMKICSKYKGTKNEIRSYLDLMGCVARLVGQRCYSGEVSCGGIPL